MKTTTTLIAAAALTLAACAPPEDPAQKFRDALPKAEAVQIGTPEAEGNPGALSVSRSALGETTALQSEYAIMSYYLALTVNSGVGFTLRFLQFVTAFPPTSCEDGRSCTWGPWVDDAGLNRWKLDVQKVGDAYEYALSGQPGTRPEVGFVPFISGTAYPVDRDHGSGTFTIDFDAQNGLDHGPLWEASDFGQIVVTYDNTKDVSVGATFLNAENDDPANRHPLNAVYSFEHGPSGGELQIAFENLTSHDVWSLRTRWAPSGAGRGDAQYDAGGDGIDLQASECWAGEVQSYAEVYDSKIPFGEENACSPFNTAQYATVVLP
jgi:hypothetical protein